MRTSATPLVRRLWTAKSMSVATPSSVSNSVSRINVPGRYRRCTAGVLPAGVISHRQSTSTHQTAASIADRSSHPCRPTQPSPGPQSGRNPRLAKARRRRAAGSTDFCGSRGPVAAVVQKNLRASAKSTAFPYRELCAASARYNTRMPILLGFIGTWDLMIIAFISMLLFGNRLPSMMRSLGKGVQSLRCPHCGWCSWHPTHCLHCGKLKLDSLDTTTDAPEQIATTGHGQTHVHIPTWLIALVVMSCAAWAADAIWGQWSSSDLSWAVWLHWTTLALVSISIGALAVVAVRSHFRDRE
jgi:hypothetical protein